MNNQNVKIFHCRDCFTPIELKLGIKRLEFEDGEIVCNICMLKYVKQDNLNGRN